MTWLVLYPGAYVCGKLKLYDFVDMDFKMLLVAVAALNLLICFVVEVSDQITPWHYLIGWLLIFSWNKKISSSDEMQDSLWIYLILGFMMADPNV